MSYAKYFYQNKNDNDDINLHPNQNLKIDYNNQPLSKKSNIGESTILNYQNKSSKINNNDNSKYNANISSSLKDQILSPGDDDISPNFGKNGQSKLSNYLDDDIIFNQINYHYLSNNNAFSLINYQTNKNNYSKLNINSNIDTRKSNKKTLILDLDETLVHSSFKPINYNNAFHKPDIFLSIYFRGNNHNVYVLKRPYVHEFLKEMNKIYNIIIFTASVKEYANPLLDVLDTEKVIKKRLFREDCCIGTTGKFIKDLKILKMNLKDLILVDNNPISYSYNICNGVPIKTWHYDKADQELIKLIPVLQFLANVNDVRDYIPKLVENDEIDFQKINYMINEFNNENEVKKYCRPRARSQKKFETKLKEKKNNSINYGFNGMINYNFDISKKSRQKPIFEESKTNLEIYNNKNINNNNENINFANAYNTTNNIKIIKKINLNDDFHHREKENSMIFNGIHGINNNFEHKNNSNYEYNNYIINSKNLNYKNDNNNLNIKGQLKYNIIKKERNRDVSLKSYLKNNNNTNTNNNANLQSIQSYYKKNYLNDNIYNLNNNYLNNENKFHYRNKSQNFNNIIKEKKEITNLSNNNNYTQNHFYKNIKDNNIKNLNNVNENINKYSNEPRKETQKNNYILNYGAKINNGFITPQITNKYTSNYTMAPLSTKNNNNNNLNMNKYKNKNFHYIQGNNNKMTDNKSIIDNNGKYYINSFKNNENIHMELEKKNNNYSMLYKDVNKPKINDFKYYGLKKSANNFEISNNQNNLKKEQNNNFNINNDFNNKTANNFYKAKNDINGNEFNNLNSNLNMYLNNIFNKEESKLNNIINQEKKDEKFDNNVKKHNSPYKISKETNYYIRRRMKLNKEKIYDKKKQIENSNLYANFNNQKILKENYLDDSNNYFYNIQQKYFNNENENYFYVNKKY